MHCLAADVRRFWPAIAAWLVVVAAAASIEGIRPLLAADPRLLNLLGVAGTLLWLAELVLLFLLIALVVQAHPLVGSDAFWMTRPIPPSTLLLSKLVLLGIAIVAAPAIVEAALMALYHVPAKEIAFVAAETALTQAALLVLLMTAAAVTRNVAGFAMLCGSAVGLLAIALSVATAILMMREDFATSTRVVVSSSQPIVGDDDPTEAFLWNVLVPSIGLVVLAVQYRSRSRLRAFALGIAGLLLGAAIVHAWPWPVLEVRVQVPEWARAPSALRLSADPSTVESGHEDQMFARRTPWKLIRAGVHLAGLDPGWSATVALRNASVAIDDRTTLSTARGGFPAAVPLDRDEEQPMRRVMRGLLGVGRVVESVPPKGDRAVVFVVRDAGGSGPPPATGLPTEALGIHERRSGVYRGRFEIDLTHHEIEATLPLAAGTTHQSGAYRFVIAGVDRTPGRVTLIARESRALSHFDRRPPSLFGFYLRNRARDGALAGYPVDMREMAFFSRFLPFSIGYSVQTSGFMARGLSITFPPTFRAEDESLPIDDAWIGGAELVIVRTTREGSVQRDLEISDFDVKPRS